VARQLKILAHKEVELAEMMKMEEAGMPEEAKLVPEVLEVLELMQLQLLLLLLLLLPSPLLPSLLLLLLAAL
jgi:hypothetical protein